MACFYRMVIMGLVYAVMSVVTFCLYGSDKRRAMRGKRRIRESTLHVCELLGGWPGALIAQRVFRHKWQKRSYMGIFWAIVGIHIIGLAWRLRAML